MSAARWPPGDRHRGCSSGGPGLRRHARPGPGSGAGGQVSRWPIATPTCPLGVLVAVTWTAVAVARASPDPSSGSRRERLLRRPPWFWRWRVAPASPPGRTARTSSPARGTPPAGMPWLPMPSGRLPRAAASWNGPSGSSGVDSAADPSFGVPRQNLSAMLLQQARIDEGWPRRSRRSVSDSFEREGSLRRRVGLEMQGRLPEAAAAYAEALRRSPGHALARRRLDEVRARLASPVPEPEGLPR